MIACLLQLDDLAHINGVKMNTASTFRDITDNSTEIYIST